MTKSFDFFKRLVERSDRLLSETPKAFRSTSECFAFGRDFENEFINLTLNFL